MTKRDKAPVPLKVEDISSLMRLMASRADFYPPIHYFRVGQRNVLAHIFTIPFRKYSIPLLVYAETEKPPRPYVVYTPLEHEESRFSDIPETGRYVSFPVVEVEPIPELVKSSLTTSTERKISGLESVHVKSLDSLMRLVSAMVDEASSPPLWCFRKDGHYVVGVIYPLFEYYDSAALPLVYYTELESKPPAPFIAYRAVPGSASITYTNSVSDARYVYGRLIFVERFPFKL
ncbi:MAG: hypothetical protein NZ570_02880 [Candidatus Caldarchaeum sp.]|nr:hypothetical protein [Candidatus Caldarchaeum sp.]MDW8360143.1 hypothetical protein [Candidatus Caldarchaeum sp.]